MLKPAAPYCLHRIDLRAEITEIFRRFHPSSTKRAIRRAEREGLTYEVGTSDRMLAEFLSTAADARAGATDCRRSRSPGFATWWRTSATAYRFTWRARTDGRSPAS